MPITRPETERIALLLGYPANAERVNEDVSEAIESLNDTQVASIQASLVEIDRLEILIKAAVTHTRAIAVEDIKLNLSYRDTLIQAASLEVKRISHVLQLNILNNYYHQSENKFNKDSIYISRIPVR